MSTNPFVTFTRSLLRAVPLPVLLLFQYSFAEEVPFAERSERSFELKGVLTSKDRHLNVSALAFSKNRDFLVIGLDEGATFQVLKKDGRDAYYASPERNIPLGPDSDELDIEGIAWGKKHLYVIGSHSRKRLRVKYKEPDPDDNKTAKQNRKRLEKTATEPSREQLFRVELDGHGKADKDSIKVVSFRNIFANDDLFRLFQPLPSKENGIDIEGIAVDGDDNLYIGFRGPVLRGNYVPVMVVEFEDKFKEKDIDYEILFVNLGGRGIRDMIWQSNKDFLILAGPVGDGPASFRLYHWNGKDCVPGDDKRDALKNVRPLCDIQPPKDDAKAEGIAILGRSDEEYEFLVVFDGIADGGARTYRCKR